MTTGGRRERRRKISAARSLHWSCDVRVGDVLTVWHDDWRGGTIHYARVLKVCAVKLKVQGERGEIAYRPAGYFSGRVPRACVEASPGDYPPYR